MSGSNPSSSKSSKTKKSTDIQELSTSIQPVPLEAPKQYFEKLPIDIEENILSRLTSRDDQLQLLRTKNIGEYVKLLLPTMVRTEFIKNKRERSESIEFKTKTTREISEFFSKLFQEASTSGLEYIDLRNNYMNVSILYDRKIKNEGWITIKPHMKVYGIDGGVLSIQFTRIEGKYDRVMITSAHLTFFITDTTNYDNLFEHLKDMFIGIKWLAFIFKRIITSERHFENKESIYIMNGHRRVSLDSLRPEYVQKSLLLFKNIGQNLDIKSNTISSIRSS